MARRLITIGSSGITLSQPRGVTLPAWVGNESHSWTTKYGGVIGFYHVLQAFHLTNGWFQHFDDYGGDYYSSVYTEADEVGYRWDLDTWDENNSRYDWINGGNWTSNEWERGTTWDELYQRCESVSNLTLQHVCQNADSDANSSPYSYQTMGYYAAQCQYLFGAADGEEVYSALDTAYDYHQQSSGFNWANLRARRGRVSPYTVDSIAIGQEANWNDAWGTSQGSSCHGNAETFRSALRTRGINLPVWIQGGGPRTAYQSGWYSSINTEITMSDIAGIDPQHYYDNTVFTADADRARCGLATCPNGYDYYWTTHPGTTNYYKWSYNIESAKEERDRLGWSSDIKVGLRESGPAATVNSWDWSDLAGALHWYGYTCRAMQENWDRLCRWEGVAENGSSSGAINIQPGSSPIVTRSAVHWFFVLAFKFQGLTYLSSTPQESTVQIHSHENWGNSTGPNWHVEVFRDQDTNYIHLFAANFTTDTQYTIPGFSNYEIDTWEELRGSSYSSNNDYTTGDETTVEIVNRTSEEGTSNALTLRSLSINRIVLKEA